MSMRFLVLFFVFPFLLLSQNNPPANYTVKNIIVDGSDHVFFNFHTNTISTKVQTGWDIALYTEGHEIGGMVNETKGVKVWRVFKDTTQFSTITLADTTYSPSNSSSIFYYGALDTMYTGTLSTSFNIGIGTFYQDNLVSVPTKMYIVKREDNVYGKFYISYKASAGRSFVIRYADMDNANSTYISVPKPTVTSSSPLTRHYKYVKLKDGTIQDNFEPAINDWDLVLRKYKVGSTEVPIGVLTNNAHNLIRLSNITGFPDEYLKQGVVKTEAYEAIGDPATVTYNGSLNSTDPISRNFNQIGEKWYNTSTGQPVSGRSYFVKDKNNRLWHLVFTSYDASSKSVNIAFEQKGSASITAHHSLTETYRISQKESKLKIESLISNTKSFITILDMTGKKVFQGDMFDTIELDFASNSNKVFIIQIESASQLFTSKFSLY